MEVYVYILFSVEFGKYYIGQSENLDTRIARHNAGVEKATKPYRPWVIVWYTLKASRAEAMELEKKLKNLSKDRLRQFIEKYGSAGPDAAKGRSGC